MTNTSEPYAGTLPEGWTGGEQFTKWWRGKHVRLYTLRKPCAQCGTEMRIDVTKAALDGTAKNAGLHLKRCARCRAETKALNASSRPRIPGEPPPRKLYEAVSETAETTIATMREELDAVHAENRELRSRLAKYELAPAMEAVAADAKMPWEG